MTVVAAAIIGGAVVGAGASIYTGSKSAGAIESGARSAADATVMSTQMQVDEIRRQFDYQAEVLYPRVQAQYAASSAFGDLMGIGVNNQPSSSNYDPGRSVQTFNSSGAAVGGSGSYAPTPGGGVQRRIPGPGGTARPGGPGGQPNQAQGPGGFTRQGGTAGPVISQGGGPGGMVRGAYNAVTSGATGGRLFDNEGREIDPNQSGLVPPEMQAEFEASGMTPFDFANSQGLIPPNYRGGASTGEFEVAGGGGPPIPQYPGSGSTQFQRGSRGQFIDPNVDPLALSDAEGLTGQVRNTLLAPGEFADDVYGNYVSDNQYAAGSVEESNMFRRSQDASVRDDFSQRNVQDYARENEIFGKTFEEGPGYNFMVEEMQRETDRKNSAGGNYGGRALMEAQRRRKGVAAGEYYNWAEGRGRDVDRTLGAVGTDVARMDQAGMIDIGRGDEAVSEYERQRGVDVGRGDRSMESYLGRREGDVTRMDSAVREQDRLRGVDLAREDAAYQNYLANLRAQAGFGDASAQLVDASAGASAGISNAYGNQGSQLSSTYQNEGTNLATTYGNTGANVNNAIQSGIQNYSTYNYLQNNPGTPVTLPPPG